MSNYQYYQLEGGSEDWVLTQVGATDYASVKPTYITVLSLDKIVEAKPDREFLESIKYAGPLYFDLDDANDVSNSIRDAQELVTEILETGVRKEDIDVFLTGKKGLHVLIPQSVFMAKPGYTRFLPQIYKEVAFALAKTTLDFRVYTARRGRMFRTTYNQRDNGKYKSYITVDELMALDLEKYQEICSVPSRRYSEAEGKYCPKFALLYDTAAQKYTSRPKSKPKQTTPAQVKAQEAFALMLMGGAVDPDAGFNRIAMQLALYAREAGWSEEGFLNHSHGLIHNHNGDGYRYNTSDKRSRALAEMFYYVDDNPGYEYSLGGLKAVSLQKAEEEEAKAIGETTHNLGVFMEGSAYWVNRADGEPIAISNFVLVGAIKLVDPRDDTIVSYKVRIEGDSAVHTGVILNLTPSQFTSSASLHGAVNNYGGSFTGSDAQARGLQQVMLKSLDSTNYVIDTEGLNVINIPKSRNEALRKPFMVWADSEGVFLPEEQSSQGVNFTFQGNPEPQGVLSTDISKAPTLRSVLDEDGAKERLTRMLTNMFSCYDSEVIAKALGWSVACYWRQPFHQIHGKFPLLHIYGPAGSGKTEMIMTLQKLFYYQQNPPMVTPSSTPFAMLTLVGGSASIPIVLDEYKPGRMDKLPLEKYRGYFRDAYNQKDTSRGGGNSKRDSFNALSRLTLSGPIAFIAEAMETETAIVERIVLIPYKRQAPAIAARNYLRYLQYREDSELLSSFGNYIAGNLVRRGTLESFQKEFDTLYKQCRDENMLREGDDKLVEEGTMPLDEYKRRASNRERNVYNNSVAVYGLNKFKGILRSIYKDDFDSLFGEVYTRMENSIFAVVSAVAESIVPEYIKVLNTMSNMTRIENLMLALRPGVDYEIHDVGGQSRLVLDPGAAFAKYRGYMRNSAVSSLFESESQFATALGDTPQYLGSDIQRLSKSKGRTISLDYESLQAQGLHPFDSKVVVKSNT